MNTAPKWFRPLASAALLWNLAGCYAYLLDVRRTPEELARMSADMQALYAARPAWAVGATATGVWLGAIGCAGLVMRRRWAVPLLVMSLLGVIVQDVALFGLAHAATLVGAAPLVLQGLVLLVAIGLVLLARRAAREGWLS